MLFRCWFTLFAVMDLGPTKKFKHFIVKYNIIYCNIILVVIDSSSFSDMWTRKPLASMITPPLGLWKPGCGGPHQCGAGTETKAVVSQMTAVWQWRLLWDHRCLMQWCQMPCWQSGQCRLSDSLHVNQATITPHASLVCFLYAGKPSSFSFSIFLITTVKCSSNWLLSISVVLVQGAQWRWCPLLVLFLTDCL